VFGLTFPPPEDLDDYIEALKVTVRIIMEWRG
jgi:hypothetical protein